MSRNTGKVPKAGVGSVEDVSGYVATLYHDGLSGLPRVRRESALLCSLGDRLGVVEGVGRRVRVILPDATERNVRRGCVESGP